MGLQIDDCFALPLIPFCEIKRKDQRSKNIIVTISDVLFQSGPH